MGCRSAANPTAVCANMLVRNCTFDGTEAGIRLKSPRGRGGIAENLTYENLTMKNVKNSILITSYYPTIPVHAGLVLACTRDRRTPIWRHIRIRNVTSVDSDWRGRSSACPRCPSRTSFWKTCGFPPTSRCRSCMRGAYSSLIAIFPHLRASRFCSMLKWKDLNSPRR